MVAFEVASRGHAALHVYDVRGRWVTTLVDDTVEAGRKTFQWDGIDASGRAVSSGVYFLRLETSEGMATRKVALVR